MPIDSVDVETLAVALHFRDEAQPLIMDAPLVEEKGKVPNVLTFIPSNFIKSFITQI